MSYDDRPDGWGICCVCGKDCDDESDYNAVTRTSTHRACEDRAPKDAAPKQPDFSDFAVVGRGQA